MKQPVFVRGSRVLLKRRPDDSTGIDVIVVSCDYDPNAHATVENTYGTRHVVPIRMLIPCPVHPEIDYALPPDVLAEVPWAFARVCKVFRDNAPTPHRADRTAEHHVYRALSHAVAHLRGDRTEDHLALACARLMLAMGAT